MRELDCVKFQVSPAVLMAIFSSRLGAHGLTMMHFKESSEMASLEDGSSNTNFSSDFSPSASLPSATTQCSTYEDILDAVRGLNALGQEVWYDHMRKLTSRLRAFVAKNKSADPGNTPARVHLTLLYVNKFIGAALGHMQVDDPQWWSGFCEALRGIDYEWSRERNFFCTGGCFAFETAPLHTKPPGLRESHVHHPDVRDRCESILTIQSGLTIQSPTAIQPPLTTQSGLTIQSPTSIQSLLTIQPVLSLQPTAISGELPLLSPADFCTAKVDRMRSKPSVSAHEVARHNDVTVKSPASENAPPPRLLRPVVNQATASKMHANAQALSELARRSGSTLQAFVELFRGQTAVDHRPNKNLILDVLDKVCIGYKHLDQPQQIAREGVVVHLKGSPPCQLQRPANHGSARERINVLRKNIRKEQDAGRCLVLDMDLLEQWPEIVISPFGVVDKGDNDSRVSGRTIHDLSYPEGSSINDCTDQDSITKPDYSHCDAVAAEIQRAKRQHPDAEILVMAGDVASAFRNVSIHSKCVYLFAGLIKEEHALVIELSAPFGWTGSPGFYEIFGGAISHVHGPHTNAACPTGFFNDHWVDDHINVAADIGSSCDDIDRSLRFAMIAVLGAEDINDVKFTSWNTRQRVLGLEFDSVAELVSMPASKIAKYRRIVAEAYFSVALTRKTYRSMMGSLRHVATCIRAAQPFLQRLRARESHLHRFQRVEVEHDMKQDLLWWWMVLHTPYLNGVSLEYFNALPAPDVLVEMDASDFGLCALDVSAKEALTYQFSIRERLLISSFKDGEANGFDINFCELLSCAFAVNAWGARWASRTLGRRGPYHVHFRMDNTSAVAWQNKLSSRNPRAQVIIRLLSWWETSLGLRFSASHAPGAENVRADAGSRISANSSFDNLFASLTSEWSQVSPTVDIQGLAEIWQHISALTPLPTPRMTNTTES